MRRHGRALCVTLALAFSLASPRAVLSAPIDNQPKILLHLGAVTGKNACTAGYLADCAQATTAGSLSQPYFAYLLVARGALPDLAGLECGILYENGKATDTGNHAGVDVFSWTLCASLEFVSPGSRIWPQPGGGNLITWNTTTVCQAGETAVAGYFYVTAYTADVMEVMPRSVSRIAKVSTCGAVETVLDPSDLGHARFAPGAVNPGCNPCNSDCAPQIPPICAASVSSLSFGSVTAGSAKSLPVTIRNDGGGVLTGTASTGGGWTVTSPNTYALTNGQSITLTVEFRPPAAGQYAGSLNPGSGCASIPLSGTGTTPPTPPPGAQCTAAATSYDFGPRGINSVSTTTLSFSNTGSTTFSGSMRLTGGGFALSEQPAFTLAPGQVHTFLVQFSPAAPGSYSATITTGVGACPSFRVYGSGDDAASCAFSPTSIDFGTVPAGLSVERTFTLTNLGSSTLTGTIGDCGTGSVIEIVGDPAYELGPGESRTFATRFTPAEAGASYVCTVTAPCGPGLSLAGLGTWSESVCTTSLVSSVQNLDLGSVTLGDSSAMTFTLTNTGAVRRSGVLLGATAEFTLNGGGAFDLDSGASTEFTVTFKPAVNGQRTCRLTPEGSCYGVDCQGLGLLLDSPLPCSVAPAALDFGSVPIGSYQDRPFTISNTGSSTIAGSVSLSGGLEFSIPGSKTYSISPGGSATFVARFSPSGSGLRSGIISTGCNQSVVATGDGAGPSQCFPDPRTLQFGSAVIGDSTTSFLTITNTGGSTLNGTVTENCPDFHVGGNASYSLAPGQSQLFEIVFQPLTTGGRSCSLSPGSGCLPTTCLGTGLTPATCVISPLDLAFGTVLLGESRDQTFQIRNDGDILLAGQVAETCPEFEIVGSPDFYLGRGSTRLITVRFTPTVEGAQTCGIDTGPTCVPVTASGAGIGASLCTVSPPSVDFGTLDIGSHQDRSFTLTNVSAGIVSGSLAERCSDFTVVGGAAFELAPNESHDFVLRFEPTVAGTQICSLNLGEEVASLPLRGDATMPPLPVERTTWSRIKAAMYR